MVENIFPSLARAKGTSFETALPQRPWTPEVFWRVFLAVFIAEWGDRTQANAASDMLRNISFHECKGSPLHIDESGSLATHIPCEP